MASRILKLFVIVLIIILIAIGATWVRYQSLNPCVWLHRDISQRYNLPALMITAQVNAVFLLHGITTPTTGQCLYAWWKHRFENAKDFDTKGVKK